MIKEAQNLEPGDVVIHPSKGEGWPDENLTVVSVAVFETWAKITWAEAEIYSLVPMTTMFDVQ